MSSFLLFICVAEQNLSYGRLRRNETTREESRRGKQAGRS